MTTRNPLLRLVRWLLLPLTSFLAWRRRRRFQKAMYEETWLDD